MHRHYRLYKLIHMKKELKEVYANQLIEYLAMFLIGIFIPAFLLESGFSFTEAVLFMLIQWAVYIPMTPVAARINARIGVKHTILLRAPIVISYLAMVMNIQAFPALYFPASILGGTSLILYWTSMNTEYVRTSDKNREGEEAGMLYGIPYLSAVIGPLAGALILTLFGFSVLFSISVALLLLSVIPLFLSDDYKESGYRMRAIDVLLDKRRALYYIIGSSMFTADFVLWNLFVFMNFGYITLGIAASLMGLGMIIFTTILGSRENTIRGRVRTVRIGGILCMILWLLRAAATTEIQFILLSFAGGFIIMLCSVPLYADFARFAKKSGPARSVAFRQFWTGTGHTVPVGLLLFLLVPVLGAFQYMQAVFVMTAILSLLLVLIFKK